MRSLYELAQSFETFSLEDSELVRNKARIDGLQNLFIRMTSMLEQAQQGGHVSAELLEEMTVCLQTLSEAPVLIRTSQNARHCMAHA